MRNRGLAVSAVVLAVSVGAGAAERIPDGPARGQQAPWPTDGWTTSTLEDRGLDEEPLRRLVRGIDAGRYGRVDRLLVVRNGYLVLDEAWEHDYEEITRGRHLEPHPYNYDHPDWHPFYMGRDVHTLQSITKSVISSLIGIAIDRGEIPGVGVEVLPYLDGFLDHGASVDPRKRRIRLVDLLTMTSGIEWHETDRPYGPTNTTDQLEAADDWIRFTLNQPMDAEPGEKWVYNSGGSHLLSGILRAATGTHAHLYAEEHLFGPLGIDDYHWKLTPRGYADTEGGLYLLPEDLAKFGYLFLRRGVWDGRQVISADWVERSTTRWIDDVAPDDSDNDLGYGYQWWRLDTRGTEVWAGLGYGGQYLLVLPEHDVVGVISSWNISGEVPRSALDDLLRALLTAAGNA